MFFPVRCVFWLGVVYTSIVWPGGAGPALPTAEGAAALAPSLAAVSGTLMDVCRRTPTTCLSTGTAMAGAIQSIVPVPLPRPAATASGTDTLRASDRTAVAPPAHPLHRASA